MPNQDEHVVRGVLRRVRPQAADTVDYSFLFRRTDVLARFVHEERVWCSTTKLEDWQEPPGLSAPPKQQSGSVTVWGYRVPGLGSRQEVGIDYSYDDQHLCGFLVTLVQGQDNGCVDFIIGIDPHNRLRFSGCIDALAVRAAVP